MKKATKSNKGTPKNLSKITKKSGSAPVVSRVKALAKQIVTKGIKAMSPKSASPKSVKRPQAKVAPKAAPVKAAAKVAPAPKHAVLIKAPVAAKKGKVQPPTRPSTTPAKKEPEKALPLASKGKAVPPTKPSAPVSASVSASVSSPISAVVLTKGKGEAKAPKVKGTRMTAAQLAEHQEKMCRETACENLATTKGYCRLDYIKNWKKIKRKEMILKEGKLNQYIEELVSKYPEKYIDVIRQDLQTEVNFNKVIHDLELDESIDDLDYDGDSIDALIGGIKKESEDFGDEDF